MIENKKYKDIGDIDIHPMSIREIFEESFYLYKENFIKFIEIVLLVKAPYLILTFIISKIIGFFYSEVSSEGLASLSQSSENIVIRISELIFIAFLSPIMIAVMAIYISNLFLDNDIKIKDAYSRITSRLFPLFGTVFLTGTIISSGFILGFIFLGLNPQLTAFIFLIAPILAFVLWVWYSLVPQVVIIEGEGGIGAMKRSKYLISGFFKKAFILVVITFLASSLVSWLAEFAVNKILMYLKYDSPLFGNNLSNIISIIIEPFRMAIVTLLYFDLRARKEGFDIEMLSKEVDYVEHQA